MHANTLRNLPLMIDVRIWDCRNIKRRVILQELITYTWYNVCSNIVANCVKSGIVGVEKIRFES